MEIKSGRIEKMNQSDRETKVQKKKLTLEEGK
jgi:hypothetical protein